MSVTVTVKDIGYGRRIITGVAGAVRDGFIGNDLDKLLDYMKEQGQVEMMQI